MGSAKSVENQRACGSSLIKGRMFYVSSVPRCEESLHRGLHVSIQWQIHRSSLVCLTITLSIHLFCLSVCRPSHLTSRTGDLLLLPSLGMGGRHLCLSTTRVLSVSTDWFSCLLTNYVQSLSMTDVVVDMYCRCTICTVLEDVDH